MLDGLRRASLDVQKSLPHERTGDRLAVAVEEYADLGPLHGFLPAGGQGYQMWGVFDRNSRTLAIEAGVGFGLTRASDGLTLKLILSRDLN